MCCSPLCGSVRLLPLNAGVYLSILAPAAAALLCATCSLPSHLIIEHPYRHHGRHPPASSNGCLRPQLAQERHLRHDLVSSRRRLQLRRRNPDSIHHPRSRVHLLQAPAENEARHSPRRSWKALSYRPTVRPHRHPLCYPRALRAPLPGAHLRQGSTEILTRPELVRRPCSLAARTLSEQVPH